jgi:ribosomal protein S19E (S16A)
MLKLTAEEARWLRQLIGDTQKIAPEVIQRRLRAMNFVKQTPTGLAITQAGRQALQRASTVS